MISHRSSGIALVLGLLLFLGLASLSTAQTPTPNQINEIARELWCPLCNGVRLDNCELLACVQMREVIAQKLSEGVGQEEIKAYFVEQYGDVVLGAPANEGFNRLVWLLPVLLAVVGAGWLIYFVRILVRRGVDQRELPIAIEQAPDEQAGDDYTKRVDAELDRYQ